MRVLVAHSGIQHAHQLAWALEEAGWLAGFWSGVPVVDARAPDGEFWGRFRGRLRAVPIPAAKRRHAAAFPLLRRLGSATLPSQAGNAFMHRLDHAYDRWTAWQIRALSPDIVVCYENSALRSFRAARAAGALCVLDAASVHYRAARAWGGGVSGVNPAWIDAQKQQEIELADAILTCSELAAETYRAVGVPAGKLFAVPLGANLPEIPPPARPPGGPCRFAFAGAARRLKGVDWLLDIFAELAREGAPAALTLAGGVAEADLARRARGLGNVTVHPPMPQPALFEILAGHDCLLLPSRFDAFGMVVPEAMALGVPALVSDRAGAKCVIEAHPDAGWIVPCEKDAIKAQILRLAARPELLAEARGPARAAARDYSWAAYRQRAAQTLLDIATRHGIRTPT
jgi:glycosyltransferase involved in cell wall biosynthesis